MKTYEILSLVLCIYVFIGYFLYPLPLSAFALGWIIGYVIANSIKQLFKKKNAESKIHQVTSFNN